MPNSRNPNDYYVIKHYKLNRIYSETDVVEQVKDMNTFTLKSKNGTFERAYSYDVCPKWVQYILDYHVKGQK